VRDTPSPRCWPSRGTRTRTGPCGRSTSVRASNGIPEVTSPLRTWSPPSTVLPPPTWSPTSSPVQPRQSTTTRSRSPSTPPTDSSPTWCRPTTRSPS
jgi:hypothetical protein